MENEEVYSITEDGTAKGGPLGAITFLFDQELNQIIVSGIPGVSRLRQDSSYHSVKEGFAGTWSTASSDKDAGLLYVPLIIELTDEGAFRIREEEVIDNREFQNVIYDSGVIRGISYSTSSSVIETFTWHPPSFDRRTDVSERRWPFEIARSGEGLIIYKDFRGQHTLEKL